MITLVLATVLGAFLCRAFSPATTKKKTLPSKEVDLSYWGLNDPSQIGYVSVGILHKQTGDELIVYHISRQEPVVPEPKGARGKVPHFKEGVFLVDDFCQGNVNRLGGYFSSFSKPPSVVDVTIEKSSDNIMSLAFSYIQVDSGFAGFWIQFFDSKAAPMERVYMDCSPFNFVTFSVRGEKGTEKLILRVADREWEKREDSLNIGDLEQFLPSGRVDTSWQRGWVPIQKFPGRINRKELAGVVFLAEKGEGKIFIKDIAFTKTKDAKIPKPQYDPVLHRDYHTGLWLWETEKIMGDAEATRELLQFCMKQRITDLFMQLPYQARKDSGKWEILWDRPKISSLISKLHGAGVLVHALDGDPRFALRQWHDRVISVLETVIQYNNSQVQETRFDGIRLDIEPYLLSNFAGVEKESITKQYLAILKKSKQMTACAQIELGVDIPFWYDSVNRYFEPLVEIKNRPLSEWILDIADNVGIMDYRTKAYGPDGTITHAIDEMEYAAATGKKVFVGFETSSLPDETILNFSRGEGKSTVLFKKLDGTKVVLTWIPTPNQSNDMEGTYLFQKNRIYVPSGKITFAEKKPSDLSAVKRKTAREFRKFPSFYGFAIHSYESYHPWLESGSRQIKFHDCSSLTGLVFQEH